ncbi:MAG: N-6 DNA methylase [Lachnospiraceae bacterium]|nr:N-6 DNA methylase [Lachnospiraceae bacterium]
MNKEIEYTNLADNQHIKAFGQYFTQDEVADFMCLWACKDAHNVLDPAVGNSVFLLKAREHYPECDLHGYEIDPKILAFFGNPTKAVISNADYLLNDWDLKYDAIVCNPPYNRFQSVSNREGILETIRLHTGIRYSAYTNLYILFLIKSIYQLSNSGRLAYIIPTEFLNSRYGTPIKAKLLADHLLRAIINFEHDKELFYHATTTCCILLLDRSPKEKVLFYNLSSVSALKDLTVGQKTEHSISIPYDKLDPKEKWRSYLFHEEKNEYANLTDIANFCRVSRGIATGANEFFCMSESKIRRNKIPMEAVTRCICRSADVKKTIFTEDDFNVLAEADKTVYLLNISVEHAENIDSYIAKGEAEGIHKKHLPAHRHPWYTMEKKPIAPIWVSSACRDGMKFVRNLAHVNSLTTFHSLFVKEEYEKDINIIFCYFLTPIAQRIIRDNRKELGNGLEKFQPGDLNHAKMLDIKLITEEDYHLISDIYENMKEHFETDQVEELNGIFSNYLLH